MFWQMGNTKADCDRCIYYMCYVSRLIDCTMIQLTNSLSSSVGIALAFTIPRVPEFAFSETAPLKNGTAPPETIFSRSPANFSFAANVDLQIDTTSNFLPLKFNRLDAQVFDLETELLVATGNLTNKKLPAKQLADILLPLNFTYVATNDSDPTCTYIEAI